ncbi:alpha-amylase family glycosyl hydrolase [Tropicimonas sp. IMCC34043]|uniref:alpha-amylase family glycosyl hydrolase n=1 Tax=Tropicimonas sp. IMCC34043 TaxID=2248760 RepID=UPI000E266D3B|nr:alpha-amylase family glycosyl hydrolase [Tropicimonas sp. IMCC34043]
MDQDYESRLTLSRILDEIAIDRIPARRRKAFLTRLEALFPDLFGHMITLYGTRYDAYVHMRALVATLAEHQVRKQPEGLREEGAPWYLSERAVGMAVYVDLFAGDLDGLIEKIPYLEQLGISYLHLMPLFLAPEDNSDGGYAVSDYRKVNPALGDAKTLRKLADALHARGIRLSLDFVFNHTSDEHAWAQAALDGDPRYRAFYFFVDGAEAEDYNRSLREIFPQARRGSFTWNEAAQKWVWTTFNSFQWDLNYANPDVFVSVVGEMLSLVGMGCDVLRLDALAFVWKEKGTTCESQPKAHVLIRAFNLCLRIAAPHVVFKSEAIVHPDEVNSYIAPEECQISYNPLMMALMWESLATRQTALLRASLARSFAIPETTAWVNYIRCHDDIGWTWDDAVSNSLGINGADHRRFLNAFYTGRFEGSFADGVAFGENPDTGDCRVCGTLASLAGVGKAMAGTTQELDHALARVRVLHAVTLAMPGMPLLYQGDEIGVLNDLSFEDDPDKRDDSRWVHRKALTTADFDLAQDSATPQGRIAAGIARMIDLRRKHPVFGRSDFRLLDPSQPNSFAFLRRCGTDRLLVAVNFSEYGVTTAIDPRGLLDSDRVVDLLDPGAPCPPGAMALGPYAAHWYLAAD